MFSFEAKRALANQLDFSFISVTSQTANISVESYELCVRMSIISGSSTAQCSVSNLIYLLSVVLKYLDSDPQSSIHVPSRVSCFFCAIHFSVKRYSSLVHVSKLTLFRNILYTIFGCEYKYYESKSSIHSFAPASRLCNAMQVQKLIHIYPMSIMVKCVFAPLNDVDYL